MSEPSPSLISEGDVRALVRLLADVAVLEEGHEAKKRLLMDGLIQLAEADYWIWGLAADYDPDRPVSYIGFDTGGFERDQFPKLLVALDNRELEDAMRHIGREIVANRVQMTRLPAEYDPENALGRDHIRAVWEEAGFGAPLVCYRPVAHGSISSIGLYRKFHRPGFTEREAKIVDIVLSEVGWLHEQGWPWEPVQQAPQLAPRCRLTLNLLLEGLSRKEIAAEMGVSIHTVNDYAKHLYDFFGVHSQAELLTRFRGRTRPLTP